MKSRSISLLLLCSLVFSLNLHANESFFGLITHDVVRDSFAQGGNIFITTDNLESSEEFFEVKIRYDLDVQVFFFNRNVKGEEAIQMPVSYMTEQGFRDLEREGIYKDPRVDLTYLGRTDWGDFYDCHRIKLDPVLHNRWDGEFVNCPDAPKSGIVQMKLFIKNIPLLGQGTVLSKWNPQR